MTDAHKLEFFLLRYAPDAVKDEFVNIGVALLDTNGSGFANVRFTHDWSRVLCLDPAADVEVLAALEGELRARLRDSVEDRTKFMQRMEESFSGAVQLSSTKAVAAQDAPAELARLAEMYLERRRGGKRAVSGRQAIVGRMRDAFEQAGVWTLMRKRIRVADYTHPGDPLKIDCGYRPNGVIRMFHGLALGSDIDSAKVLAFSWPQIVDGIARAEHAKAAITAIVEDDLDRSDDAIAFALATLERSSIAIAPESQLEQLASMARQELRV